MIIFIASELSDVLFIMLIYVSILTFKSMINFMLSWAEHGKSFITLGPDLSFELKRITALNP